MAIRLQRAPEKAAMFTGVAMLLRAWVLGGSVIILAETKVDAFSRHNA